jgi:hypothetical protein
MNEEAFKQFIQGLRGLLTEQDYATLATALAQHTKFCRSKNYKEEGIPMYLVLEDVSNQQESGSKTPTPHSGDQMFHGMLVAASELIRQQLQQRQENLRSEDISILLEVLAERYFTFVSFSDWEQ